MDSPRKPTMAFAPAACSLRSTAYRLRGGVWSACGGCLLPFGFGVSAFCVSAFRRCHTMTLHEKTVLAKRTHLTLPLNKKKRHWLRSRWGLDHGFACSLPSSLRFQRFCVPFAAQGKSAFPSVAEHARRGGSLRGFVAPRVADPTDLIVGGLRMRSRLRFTGDGASAVACRLQTG